jgi:hypothetical protein
VRRRGPMRRSSVLRVRPDPYCPRPLRDALAVALGLRDGAPPRPLVVGIATLTLLDNVAGTQPVLLAVDDLHWIDRASAVVIGMVARRLDGPRSSMIATARTTDAAPFLRAGFLAVEVDPLERADAERLVAEHYPGLPRKLEDRLLDEARGDPLALLAFGAGATRLLVDGHYQLTSVFPLSGRVEDVIGFSIDKLAHEDRQLLLRIALVGHGDLRALADDEHAGELLASAARSGLIEIDATGRSVRFRHPLVRSTIVTRANTDARREAHRRIAEALTDDPDRRSWHLAEATIGPDEDIARRLVDAAHRALGRGDAGSALDALVRASRLSPDPHDESRRLVEAAYLGADITSELTPRLAVARRRPPCRPRLPGVPPRGGRERAHARQQQ